MSSRLVSASLAAISSLGLAIAIRLVASPLVRTDLPPPSVGATSPAALRQAPPPDAVPADIVARDLFRPTRRPSPVVYDPARLTQPPWRPSVKPLLVLVGIVWDRGNDPTALVEGFPGAEGARAVRRGETIAGLRVNTITLERVVIAGLDTTWTLTVREPWR